MFHGQRLDAIFSGKLCGTASAQKASYAARCGKLLQNVRPIVVNFAKCVARCDQFSQNVRPGPAILCKLCGIFAAGVWVFMVSKIK